jgi:integrase
MASVRKRTWTAANGEAKEAWIADYFDQFGKRHIKTFARKKDAEAWRTTTQHEVKQGIHTPERDSVTVATAGELWIERGEREELERSTIEQYRDHLEHIKPLIGGTKLAHLSAPTIEQFRDDLLGKLSRSMAKKVLTSLKGMLAEAQRRGLVAQNTATAVNITTKGREKTKLRVGRDIPTKAEVSAILEAATRHWRPLLVTAVFTGMRASELRGLTWDDVDLDQKVIHVRQRADQWNKIGSPKSEAGHRTIPMSPMVLNALREWKLACPRIGKTKDAPGRLWLVFPTKTGKPDSHANILQRGFHPIQIAAGVFEPHPTEKDENGKPLPVAKYGLHSLRHFFASWAIEQGFTPKRLQALMGHSSIGMTFDTYGHLFPSLEDDHAKFAAGELTVVK